MRRSPKDLHPNDSTINRPTARIKYPQYYSAAPVFPESVRLSLSRSSPAELFDLGSGSKVNSETWTLAERPKEAEISNAVDTRLAIGPDGVIGSGKERALVAEIRQ